MPSGERAPEPDHFARERFHVPYKGDVPAIQDVMAGRVDFVFGPTAPILPHMQAGKLRALAVAMAARVPSLPNVPTIAEAGVPNFEAALHES